MKCFACAAHIISWVASPFERRWHVKKRENRRTPSDAGSACSAASSSTTAQYLGEQYVALLARRYLIPEAPVAVVAEDDGHNLLITPLLLADHRPSLRMCVLSPTQGFLIRLTCRGCLLCGISCTRSSTGSRASENPTQHSYTQPTLQSHSIFNIHAEQT